jgi:signal transduction histidine kinase
MAQTELGNTDGAAAELVDEALASAQRGIDEMREIARGIHPRILSSGGLGPALKTLARRSPIPATVEMHAADRLPDSVEVTAYYVASEALTNAVKHAQASEVRITVDVDDGWIVLTIGDDGVGGADASAGSGLIGLHDRVAAAGGTLHVRSERATGTVVIARIPLAVPATTDPDV